jgi:hypothetical protein
MNFTLAVDGKEFATDDPQKLPQRLINHTQALTRSSLKGMPLREALGSSDELVNSLRKGLQSAEAASARIRPPCLKTAGFSATGLKRIIWSSIREPMRPYPWRIRRGV